MKWFLGIGIVLLVAVAGWLLWFYANSESYCFFNSIKHNRNGGAGGPCGRWTLEGKEEGQTRYVRLGRQNGAHPMQLQLLLGHATLKTLGQYLRLTITELKKTHARSKPGQ